jgi:hypothetical protein
MLTNE